MDPNRWRKIEEVFHQAIELPGDARSDYVNKACQKLPEIKAEVISLLEQHVDESGFLEKSPVPDIGGNINHVAEALASEMSTSL